jgi:hypothetical protein
MYGVLYESFLLSLLACCPVQVERLDFHFIGPSREVSAPSPLLAGQDTGLCRENVARHRIRYYITLVQYINENEHLIESPLDRYAIKNIPAYYS